MNLPPQAKPVDRNNTTADKPREDKRNGVVPQTNCGCVNNQWWCVIGRDVWNTGYPCTS
jgi:hypothetical protein